MLFITDHPHTEKILPKQRVSKYGLVHSHIVLVLFKVPDQANDSHKSELSNFQTCASKEENRYLTSSDLYLRASFFHENSIIIIFKFIRVRGKFYHVKLLCHNFRIIYHVVTVLEMKCAKIVNKFTVIF
jgi:hypothetical protein